MQEITPEPRLPDIGGAALTTAFRYYPVDNVAVLVGGRGYFGLSSPAAGTAAATVITPFLGVRYDLVREARFSLLADVVSGPTFFVFADLTEGLEADLLRASWALGGEVAAALAARYTLGPFTVEARLFIGGRAGSAQQIGRPTGDIGPFSAVYAGTDLGVTWSFMPWNDSAS